MFDDIHNYTFNIWFFFLAKYVGVVKHIDYISAEG